MERSVKQTYDPVQDPDKERRQSEPRPDGGGCAVRRGKESDEWVHLSSLAQLQDGLSCRWIPAVAVLLVLPRDGPERLRVGP